MMLAWDLILRCLLLPSAMAFVTGWSWSRPRWLPRASASAVGCGCGFLAAFCLLELENLQPVSYWHWLPWLGLLAGLASCLGVACGGRAVATWSIWLVPIAASAWKLVPTWEKLHDVRVIISLMFGLFLLALVVSLRGLARRAPLGMFAGSLVASAFGAALFLAAFVSLRFGLLTASLGAALAAASCAAHWAGVRDASGELVLPHAILVSGMLLVGFLNANLSIVSFLLIPIAPACLWIGELRVLAGMSPAARTMLRLIAVTIPITAALFLGAQGVRESP